MNNSYKEQPIRDITDAITLVAIREVCANAFWIDKHISVGDDGEWDYKLRKVLSIFREELEELLALNADDVHANLYNGELTLEKLVSEFSDFYGLVSCVSPLGEAEAKFVIAYEYLEKKVEQIKSRYKKDIIRNYFWDDVHPDIKRVSQERHRGGHYADSVEAAFKEVIKRVKDYVNVQTGGRFDGDKAMNRAFGFENQVPLIKFNTLISEEERDEQRGILNLYKGIVGIRNRKAHENVVLDNKLRAMEYIALASLLLNLFEEFIPE